MMTVLLTIYFMSFLGSVDYYFKRINEIVNREFSTGNVSIDIAIRENPVRVKINGFIISTIPVFNSVICLCSIFRMEA